MTMRAVWHCGSVAPIRADAALDTAVVLTWRKVSLTAKLMVDPRNGARAVIRDTRSNAGRYLWSVLAAGEMNPMSDGRTDDLAPAQSIAEGALREYAEHAALASAREREWV